MNRDKRWSGHKRPFSQQRGRDQNKLVQVGRKQLNNTRKLHSQSSKKIKQSSPNNIITEAITARILTASPQQNNEYHRHAQQAPKLNALPILPSPGKISILNYQNHKITTIPKNFASLYCSLTRLNLAYNQLSYFAPACFIQSLQELNMAGNMVNQVPKQVKRLKNLVALDLSYNKLWYLSQVVPLKELIQVRVQQMQGRILINLQGNSVVKTNQKAVHKILSSASGVGTEAKPQTEQIRNLIAGKLQENKQSWQPNRVEMLKDNGKTLVDKGRKSLNQSLLDVSAIMGFCGLLNQQKASNFRDVPQTAIQPIVNSHSKNQAHPQKLNNNDKSELFSNDCKNQKLFQFKSIYLDSKTLFQHCDFGEECPYEPKTSQHASLFKKVDNFQAQFILPSKELLSSCKLIQYKLKLIQNLKQIPPALKDDFLHANLTLSNKLQLACQLLEPFDNFFNRDVGNLFQNLSLKLPSLKRSEIYLNSFHDKIIQSYLNAAESPDIKWYEVWLHQFNLSHKFFINIQTLLNRFIQVWKKVQKLSKVTRTIPNLQNKVDSSNLHLDKKQGTKQMYSSKKASSKKQLNYLLFSQDKYRKSQLFCSQKKQSLLLSQKQIKSITAKSHLNDCPKDSRLENNDNCLECPIKQQQIIQLNESLKEEQKIIISLNSKIAQLHKELESLANNKEFQLQIQKKQRQIVDQLSEIKPSTYQTLLLSQAITIEQLIFEHEKNFGKNTLLLNGVGLTESTKQKKTIKKKQSNGQVVGFWGRKQTSKSKRDKIELNEFLLTEQSTNSNKNYLQKSFSRTYFKSNRTKPFSNAVTGSQNKTLAQNKDHKNNFTQNTKPFSNHTKRQIGLDVQKSKSLQKGKSSIEHDLKTQIDRVSTQKNEVFQKIIVSEFDQIRQLKNSNNYQVLNQDIEQEQEQVIEYHKQDKEKQQQPIQSRKNYAHTKKLISSKNQNFKSRNHQNQTESDPDHKKIIHGQSFSPLNSQKRCNTYSTLPFATQKQLVPVGYYYEMVPTLQNIQYQNYLKHHLRNNIKQILANKQSLNQDDALNKQLNFSTKKQNFKPHPSQTLVPSFNRVPIKNRDLLLVKRWSSSEQKISSVGKYIKKHRCNDVQR